MQFILQLNNYPGRNQHESFYSALWHALRGSAEIAIDFRIFYKGAKILTNTKLWIDFVELFASQNKIPPTLVQGNWNQKQR